MVCECEEGGAGTGRLMWTEENRNIREVTFKRSCFPTEYLLCSRSVIDTLFLKFLTLTIVL